MSTSQKSRTSNAVASKYNSFAYVRLLIDVATPMVETACYQLTEGVPRGTRPKIDFDTAAQANAAIALRFWLRDWADHLNCHANPVDELEEADRDSLAEVALRELREWSQIALDTFDESGDLGGADLCLHCADRILWRAPDSVAKVVSG